MDHIKLYSSSTSILHNLLDITIQFSYAISMELVTDKYKPMSIEGTSEGFLLNQQQKNYKTRLKKSSSNNWESYHWKAYRTQEVHKAEISPESS